ncbi:hypothetical protein HYS48_02875 [Candidatus Woesearchaeota archaeon]|nr:hypothetical protein [Candidatus Woesearchaeota archaeon]
MAEKDKETDLMGLLEEAEEERAATREHIAVPVPEFDPVLHLASILQQAGQQDLPAISELQYAEGIATSYLAKDRKDRKRAAEMLLRDGKPVHQAAFAAVVQELGLTPEAYQLGSMEERIRKLSAFLEKQVEDVVRHAPPKPLPADRKRKEPATALLQYQDPVEQFIGFDAGILAAAKYLMPHLAGFTEELTAVRTVEELRNLVFLSMVMEAMPDADARAAVRKDILQGELAQKEALLYALLTTNGRNGESWLLQEFPIHGKPQTLQDAVRWYHHIVAARKDAMEEMRRQGEVFRKYEGKETYSVLAAELVQRIQQEFGIFVEAPQNVQQRKEYEQLKNGLVQTVLQGWKIDEEEKTFQKGDLAVTVKALGEGRYKDGPMLDELPLHTMLRRMECGHFEAVGKGGHYGFDKAELAKVKRVLPHHLTDEEMKVGDKVEVVVRGTYGITDEGSWGYVRELGEDNVNIEFRRVTGKTHDTPCMYRIEKRHVKKVGIFANLDTNVSPLEQALQREEPVFDAGDRVRIKEGSERFGEAEGIGEVVQYNPEQGKESHFVKFLLWEDWYNQKDLEFAKIPQRWKEKEAAWKKQVEEFKEKHKEVAALKERVEQALPAIIEDAEKEYRQHLQERESIIQSTVQRLTELGLSEGIIRFIMKEQFGDAGENFYKLKPTLFDALNELVWKGDYQALGNQIAQRIQDELGIIIDDDDVRNEQPYKRFREGLADRVLRGRRVAPGEGRAEEGQLAIVKTDVAFPRGTLVRVVRVWTGHYYGEPLDCGDQKRVNLQDMAPLQPAYDFKFADKIEVGAEVEVVNHEEEKGWNKQYLAERKENVPIGSRGTIVENLGNGGYGHTAIVQFEKKEKHTWTRDWLLGRSVKQGYVQFYLHELLLIQPDNEEKAKIEAEKARLMPTLNGIVSRLEGDLAAVRERRLTLAQRGIMELQSLGYTPENIRGLFTQHAKQTADLEAAGLFQ